MIKILVIGDLTLNLDKFNNILFFYELDITMNYDYILISGGDGLIRRSISFLYKNEKIPPIIINPIGSFNVLSKLYHISNINNILYSIEYNKKINIKKHFFYSLNNEYFLFSAGNMNNLQHILLAETLRFGYLEKGFLKYFLSIIFLLPFHLFITPFMLLSKRKFFIFIPFSFISKFGSFYGRINEDKLFEMKSDFNLFELDGDIVSIIEKKIIIKRIDSLSIVI